MNLPRTSLFAPVVLASLSCGFLLGCINISTSPGFDDTSDASPPLGSVSIDYAALSDGDVVVQASVGTRSEGIPATSLNIAKGSVFLLSPIDRRPAPAAAGLFLMPADDASITIAPDGRTHALTAGVAGVIIRTADGATVDFLNLAVSDVASVSIERSDLVGTAAVAAHVGDTVLLGARALDATRDVLAGSLPWLWTVSDPAVLDLAPTSKDPGSRVRVTVKAAGTARITVTGDNVSDSLDVAVSQ